MAYDFSKERKTDILQLEENDRGEYLYVTHITKPNDSVVIDLRRWYTDQEGEVKPTSKGLRMGLEAIPDIVGGLVEASKNPDGFKEAAKALIGLGYDFDDLTEVLTQAFQEAEGEQAAEDEDTGDTDGEFTGIEECN